MKSNRFFFQTAAVLFMAALIFRAATADAASFTASLDRDSITLGETATMSLAFEGGKANNLPTPEVPGLRIVQSGSSQNVSIINGQMTSTVTVTYSVTPQRAGEFTIPALTADVNGQRLSTEPLKLTARKADAPSAAAVNSGSEIAFLKLTLPHEKFYSGQTVIGRVELYLRDDVQNFGNFQFTGTPAEGFSVGKMIEGQRTRTQVGNRVYTVIQLLLPLTAVKSGALTLGPFTASAVVVLPSQNQGGNPFFQMLNQGEQRQVSLATEQLAVQALPLPAENVPADFNGAIGNFSLNVTAGPTNLTVGDPITVRVQISGRGALNAVTLPDQTAWRDFKTFPPTSNVTNTDQFGFQGIKTFEQIVSPLNSDVHELPPFSFSFFNPDDGAYHTLTQPATPLLVHSAGSTPMPVIAGNKNSNAENPASPQDILPIKEDLGTLAQTGTPLIASPKFLAVQGLPVIAFLAAFIWRRRADSLANNPRLRRQRAVAQLVRDGLNDLRRLAAENKPDEFFATLFRLLQEQLGERLDCPASAITENVLDEQPALRGAQAATLAGLRELFQLCNQARYAPVRGSGELNSVAAQFEKTIGELQGVKA
ncbi:MAG: BatD family protein [Verrucomicrobiales bacterium]|nr:BatD family protein [Verrucomicrobiales bacterium]